MHLSESEMKTRKTFHKCTNQGKLDKGKNFNMAILIKVCVTGNVAQTCQLVNFWKGNFKIFLFLFVVLLCFKVGENTSTKPTMNYLWYSFIVSNWYKLLLLIGTTCVEFENVMKRTTTKKIILIFANKAL